MMDQVIFLPYFVLDISRWKNKEDEHPVRFELTPIFLYYQ